MTATDRLIEFARAPHRLRGSVRAATIRLLADSLMVGAAGSGSPGGRQVIAAVERWGQGSDARIIGTANRLPAPSAAFLNGFHIHCLEWDSVHPGAVVHALSVVTAALGAVIDRRGGCDADEALSAIAVGVDIASGLGLASTGPMRFFRPATAGTIGAALAVARLEEIERFEDVLGLAYSQAAGTMQAHLEGSIALPLQIAHAARAAVTAVDLVGSGLSGPHDALQGPFGFFALFEEGELGRYTETIGERWLIEEVATKPYPCGRASHAVLATLDKLIRNGGARPDAIRRVEAFVPPLVQRLVSRPMTGRMNASYARLCLPFLAALMMKDGLIDPRRFEPDTFADPGLAAMAGRVAVIGDGTSDPNALEPQRIVIALADGQIIELGVEHTLGSRDAPMSVEQDTAKRDLARSLAGAAADPDLFDEPLRYFTEPT